MNIKLFKSPLVLLAFISIFLLSAYYAYAAYTSDSLVVSLNFDENTGTTSADSSGNSNNGTVSGSPTWSGGNITLDGIDDKITVTHSSSMSSSNHTYEVWFTMPDSTTWSNMTATLPRLVDKVPVPAVDSGSNILVNKSTRLIQAYFAGSTPYWTNVTVGTSSTQSLIATTTSALNYSTTYHIVFTYDNTTKAGKIYVNDVLVASGTTNGNYISNTTNLVVGGDSSGNTRLITGTLHRAAVYNKSLSSTEVNANYTAGKDYNYVSAPDPTAVSASQSTVTASTNSVRANGTASSVITVTAKNSSGSVLSGKTVSLSSSRGATDTISPASATTDGSGVATFTVKSTTTGSPVITGIAGGVTLSTTQTITFTDQYVTTTGVTYTSTLDSLSMKMDVAYDSDISNAPIVIDLHGYSGPYTGTDIIQRLAKKGVFAIKTYKRGYGSSQGTQDDSGREIYDFYDAIEYIKTNYSAYVNTNNINVIGYSGGGGNAYGLITKFPDYFRSANIFFGMSDYCYDPTYSWWYNGDSSYRTGMQTNIGGTPITAADKCYSRAHYLGAKNNPYSHIQLFYDTAETIVPVSHATQYSSQNTAAGFSNVTTRISNSSSTTTESSDDFSTNLSDYSFIGNGATKFTWNNGGYIDWSGDRTSTFSSVSKKFTSLRNYGKADRIKASFNTAISSTATNGTILFGFRNSNDSSLKNAVSIIIVNNVPIVRIDYNGTFATSTVTNRDVTAFTTTLSTGTSYGFDLEINNSVVTASLKNAAGSTLETKTVNFDAAKGFDGVDSFGIYNFHGNDYGDIITGTFDNLTIDAYARWIHGYPQEGAGTAEGNITAENYFVSDIVAGTWSQPTLNTSGTMFVPGWVKTKKFQVFLGNGNDEAGNLTYDISGTAVSVSTPKTFTVEGLTGAANIALKVYDLTPNTEYNIKDSNLTDGGDSTSQATTDSNGTLSFSGTLGSTHQYDVFGGAIDTTAPVLSSISAGSLSTTGASITWTTDEAASSQVEYGLTTSYTASLTLDSSLVTSHSVALSGLTAGTTYHYRVISKDSLNNTSTSTDQTFTTSLSSSSGGGGGRSSSSGSSSITPILNPSNGCTAGDLFNANTGERCPISTTAFQGCIPGGLFSITTGERCSTTTSQPSIQSTIPQAWLFTRDLTLGVTHPEVKLLQQYLNSQGFTVAIYGLGSKGNESTYFGNLTRDALKKFQAAKNILPSAGYFGAITRAFISTH